MESNVDIGDNNCYTNFMDTKTEEEPKIDFSPVMRECQQYAKLMNDVVEAGEISESQYMDMEGSRVAIADMFCLLIFGKPFDDIRTKYIKLVTKTLGEKEKSSE